MHRTKHINIKQFRWSIFGYKYKVNIGQDAPKLVHSILIVLVVVLLVQLGIFRQQPAVDVLAPCMNTTEKGRRKRKKKTTVRKRKTKYSPKGNERTNRQEREKERERERERERQEYVQRARLTSERVRRCDA